MSSVIVAYKEIGRLIPDHTGYYSITAYSAVYHLLGVRKLGVDKSPSCSKLCVIQNTEQK
jgi:hypothetical protein